jgi:hypothetical protein
MTETVTIPFLLTLNPTSQQEQTFKGIIGGVRFAYNATLAHVLENWEANKDLPKEKQSYVSVHPFELAIGDKQYKKELNLRVAGSIKARGVGSSGELWSNIPYETTLLRIEKGIHAQDTQVLYAGNGVKTATLLASSQFNPNLTINVHLR